MSRGWESKDVESRQEMAAAEAEAKLRRVAETPEQAAKRAKRESLTLDRTRIARELEKARHERHRAMLRDVLLHLDTKLAELD
ncbi:MAG: hypothetical protein JNK87_41365 [Bryobacterales bacterium]|nr:hypothetical protein [Bryobacterales bacterium]